MPIYGYTAGRSGEEIPIYGYKQNWHKLNAVMIEQNVNATVTLMRLADKCIVLWRNGSTLNWYEAMKHFFGQTSYLVISTMADVCEELPLLPNGFVSNACLASLTDPFLVRGWSWKKNILESATDILGHPSGICTFLQQSLHKFISDLQTFWEQTWKMHFQKINQSNKFASEEWKWLLASKTIVVNSLILAFTFSKRRPQRKVHPSKSINRTFPASSTLYFFGTN